MDQWQRLGAEGVPRCQGESKYGKNCGEDELCFQSRQVHAEAEVRRRPERQVRERNDRRLPLRREALRIELCSIS
jgi:hypothetical protein